METWVIGDIHGCFVTLERLLARLPHRRRLWLVGDLVNRGPWSLEVLRWAMAEPSLVAVLGNHDLHLLARAAGVARPAEDDVLDEVLAAPDRDELLDWLRARPLLHRTDDSVLVHAGVWPRWGPSEAEAAARLAGAELASEGAAELLACIDGRGKKHWGAGLAGHRRSQVAASILTGIRTVRGDGEPCRSFTGPAAASPPGCRPWFDLLDPAWRDVTVYFGHWAAQGFTRLHGAVALDSGCVYGGSLTAIHLEDGTWVQEPLASDDRIGEELPR